MLVARRRTRQAGPLTGSLAENTVLSGLHGRPIQNRRVSGDEIWSSSQGVCDLLRVCRGGVAHRRLSGCSRRNENQHHNRFHGAPNLQRGGTPQANKFSIFTGSSRTRTPVAWWTAAVVAAAKPVNPISPIPRSPTSFISLSGYSRKCTSIGGASGFTAPT